MQLEGTMPSSSTVSLAAATIKIRWGTFRVDVPAWLIPALLILSHWLH
jgi:hypothetical protein